MQKRIAFCALIALCGLMLVGLFYWTISEGHPAEQPEAMTINAQDESSIKRFLDRWIQKNSQDLMDLGIASDSCIVDVLSTEFEQPFAAVFFELRNTVNTDGIYSRIWYVAKFEEVEASSEYEYMGAGTIHEPFGDLCLFRESQDYENAGEVIIFFAGDNSKCNGSSYSFECDGKEYTYSLTSGYILDIRKISPANSLTLRNKSILDIDGNIIMNYF